MFLYIAFAIHHVYSAVLYDIEERNGELSSIITGYKADMRRTLGASGEIAARDDEPRTGARSSDAGQEAPTRAAVVIGLGNVVLSDDGLGVHAVRRLRERLGSQTASS